MNLNSFHPDESLQFKVMVKCKRGNVKLNCCIKEMVIKLMIK